MALVNGTIWPPPIGKIPRVPARLSAPSRCHRNACCRARIGPAKSAKSEENCGLGATLQKPRSAAFWRCRKQAAKAAA